MFVKTPLKGWSSDSFGIVDLRNLRMMGRRFFMISAFALGAALAPALPAAADTECAIAAFPHYAADKKR